MRKVTKYVINIMPQFFVIFVSIFIFNNYGELKVLQDFGSYISFGMVLILLLLSWYFNRSRVFFISLLTFSMYFAASIAQSNITTSSVTFDSIAYDSICTFALIAIPLNLIFFGFLRERGILSFWGTIKFLFVFIQVFFLYWWIYLEKKSFKFVTAYNFLDYNLDELIFQKIHLFFILAFVVFAYLIYKKRSILDIASLFTLILSELMIILGISEGGRSIFFIASCLLLLLAVIQDSYIMAYHDELTTLPARRALKNNLMRLSGKYTVAMLDIDFFKKFNDTYGHDVGDLVLKMVAEVLKDVNGGGKSFRYGGEEFTILFPGKSINEAIPYLEELRQKIEKSTMAHKGKGKKKNGKALHVTASIGVAEKNDKNRKSEEVLTAADRALYRAKKKGRNCVSK